MKKGRRRQAREDIDLSCAGAAQWLRGETGRKRIKPARSLQHLAGTLLETGIMQQDANN